MQPEAMAHFAFGMLATGFGFGWMMLYAAVTQFLRGHNPVFADFTPGDRALISREMIE